MVYGLTALAASPGGDEIVVENGQRMVTVWNVLRGRRVGTLSWEGDSPTAAALPDAAQGTMAIGLYNGDVMFWKVSGARMLWHWKASAVIKAGVSSMRFSQDGQWLAVLWRDGKVGIFSVQRGGNPIISEGSGVSAVAFVPQHPEWLMEGMSDGKVELWRWQEGELSQPVQAHREAVVSLNFSVDGARMVSGSSDGTIVIWRMEGFSWKEPAGCQ
jgi:WD40 repeat protein